MNNEIKNILIKQGADFVHFVDISDLDKRLNKGFPNAILIGIALSKEYIREVSTKPDYNETMRKNNTMEEDEFHLMEIKADYLADKTAEYINSKGFDAYSQSEKNIHSSGFYDHNNHRTPLPHKTIAGLAGLGWIGKHNLLVTPQYGSAICMCSVLTNAPLETILEKPMDSSCGNCIRCSEICKTHAIKGRSWEYGLSRDDIIDITLCTTCYQCVVQCPWTLKYSN